MIVASALHPNLLIVGSDPAAALVHIRPILRAPVVSWSPRETPHLPLLSCRTFIVRDLECLTSAQQEMLSALVTESAPDIQVVSMTRRPLFPFVRDGLFLEALYYRLNVVLIEWNTETGQYTW